MCKKFYLSGICEELRSKTFVPVDTPVETILKDHEFLHRYGIKMKYGNQKLMHTLLPSNINRLLDSELSLPVALVVYNNCLFT